MPATITDSPRGSCTRALSLKNICTQLNLFIRIIKDRRIRIFLKKIIFGVWGHSMWICQFRGLDLVENQ